MAEIYRADVVENGVMSTVALKLLKPNQPQRANDLFFAEADLMGLLNHPNLVKRLEVGSVGDRLFISMEDMYGGDLNSLTRDLDSQDPPMQMTPGAVLYVVLQGLHGLAYFHQARTSTGHEMGLVHGDINPSNLLLSAYGEVKLADFGVASIPGVGAGMEDGMTAGKLHYLSPEQAQGEKLTAASDLFSVGSMLYFFFFGEVPFNGATEDEVLDRTIGGKYKLPPGTDPQLTKIFKRALAHRIRDRYQTAGEMAGDLLHYQLDKGYQFARPQMQELLDGVLGIAN
jgi:serine/threonine-protein kinase